ncbi:hypothetical protein Rctr197k_173 [Virus Rctr197k]|nr:hypothetical protein Rctr197k_173 [Virus Rctr197k]
MPRLHERLRQLIPQSVKDRIPESVKDKLRPPAWREPENPVPEWAQEQGKVKWTLGSPARVEHETVTALDSKGHQTDAVRFAVGLEGTVTAIGPDFLVFQPQGWDRGYRVPKTNLAPLTPERERKWGVVEVGVADLSIRRQGQDEPAEGRFTWRGLEVVIETPGGDKRYENTDWEAHVPDDWFGYGYFEGLPAADGDSLDVIAGPDPAGSDRVYVVEQLRKDTGEPLQPKVFIGFYDSAVVREAFLALWPEEMLGRGPHMYQVPKFLEDVLPTLLTEDGPPSSEVPDEARTAAAAVDVIVWHGLKIALEARGGEQRPTGDEQQIPAEWRGLGYFEELTDRNDKDGQELDVVVGPDDLDNDAYLVVQLDKKARFRQWKVFLGFNASAQVEAAFKLVWNPETFGGVWSLPAKRFRKLVLPRLTKGADVSLRTAMLEMEVSPHRVDPPHSVKNEGKFNQLVESMQLSGWNGRPVLVYRSGGALQALTGSHRIAAARTAGLPRIPVVFIEDNDFTTNALYTLLDDAADNYDRLRALERVVRVNAATQPAYELMLQEVAEKNKVRRFTRTSTLEVTAADVRTALPTIRRERVEREDVCPHCNEVIHEKSIFMVPPDFETTKHRPCGGIIELHTEEEKAARREQLDKAWPSLREAAKPKFCSHCGKTITANELFGRDDRWFHRPCISKGPISMDKKAEQLTRSQYRQFVHRSVRGKVLGEIDGYTVLRVNGAWIRDHIDVDFHGGAHAAKVAYIPDHEVWVDSDLDDKDLAAAIVREVVEYDAMDGGEPEDTAHQVAVALERVFREQYDGKNPFRAASRFLETSDEQAAAADAIPGGQADFMPDEAFDADALEEGAAEEGPEHTSDPEVAKEIAKDHLVEDPNYYEKEGRLELTAADVGGLALRRKGYQRYIAEHVDDEGVRHKVWIGGESKVEHGSYDGGRRQRRKTVWVVKVDGKEVGEEKSLKAAREMAEAHLGIVVAPPTQMVNVDVLAPPEGAPDPLAVLRVGMIEVRAQDLGSDIFDEPGPEEWVGHPAPVPPPPLEAPPYDIRLHHPPPFAPPAPLSKKEKERRLTENLPPLESPPPLEEGVSVSKSPRDEPAAAERTYKQFKLQPNGGYQNIMNILKLATPEELEFYGRWYDHAYEDVVELSKRYGQPVPIVAALVAVLSPNMPWEKNLEQAERILQGQTRTSAYPENTAKALHVLRTGDVSPLTKGEWGPKVGPFFESIAQPMAQRRRIVVDGHAANIWRGSYKNLADKQGPGGETIKGVTVGVKERAEMQNDYKRAGDALGITPQAAQAVTWSIWRQVVEKNRRLEKAKERKKKGELEMFGLVVNASALAGLRPEVIDALVREHGWTVVALTEHEEKHDKPAPEPKRESTPVEKLKLRPDGGYTNILKVLRLATPEEVEYWGKWYPFASSVVKELAARYGVPFEAAAGVVAVMSPGNKWHQNIEVARQIIEFWKAQRAYGPFSAPSLSEVPGPQIVAPAPLTEVTVDDDIDYDEPTERAAQLGRPYAFEPLVTQPKNAPATVMKPKGPRSYPLGFMGPTPAGYPKNVEKAMAILDGAPPEQVITGPKVTVFYQSLLDPTSVENDLVLDGHAINIWRGTKRPLKGISQPSEGERAQMVRDYQRVAKASGLSVQAVQAITWFIWKSVKGTEKNAQLQGSMEEAAAMRDAGYTDIALVGGSSTPTYLRPGDADALRTAYGDDVQVMSLDDYLEMESPEDVVEVGQRDLVAYKRDEDSPGESAGVFIRLPEEIASQWSKDGRAGEDESPPHFTVLYIGPTDASRREELLDIVGRVASTHGPLALDLKEGVDWFENHKGQSIANKSLETESEDALRTLHEALKAAVKEAGFEVKHKEPFIAHATLAYCKERDYSGPVPEGSFTADALEVWGWPEDSVVSMSALSKAAGRERTRRTTVVALSGPINVTAADLTAAKKRKRREKRHRFPGETYWLPKDGTFARTRSIDAGEDSTEIRLDPGARVLREGERDFIALGNASLEDLMKMALEKGYDAVRVKDRLAVLNENAIAERTPKHRPGWHAG